MGWIINPTVEPEPWGFVASPPDGSPYSTKPGMGMDHVKPDTAVGYD